MVLRQNFSVGAHRDYTWGRAFTVVRRCMRDALQLNHRNASGSRVSMLLLSVFRFLARFKFSGISVYFRTVESVIKHRVRADGCRLTRGGDGRTWPVASLGQ